MKKFNTFKIIQLSILILLTLFSVIALFTQGIRQYVLAGGATTVLFVIVWILLISGYVFLLIDMIILGNENNSYKEIYKAAYLDNVSNVPNRFSCDIIIEKYSGVDLPSDLAAIMISISNLRDVNKALGRNSGDELLRDFSSILVAAQDENTFIGRNGGNKFLAIIEKCDHMGVRKFMRLVRTGLVEYNQANPVHPIYLSYGYAISSEKRVTDISELISIADAELTLSGKEGTIE